MSVTDGCNKDTFPPNPTRALALDLTGVHMVALKRGIALRIAECREMIDALKATNNERTELADFWRRQLAAAIELQGQVCDRSGAAA